MIFRFKTGQRTLIPSAFVQGYRYQVGVPAGSAPALTGFRHRYKIIIGGQTVLYYSPHIDGTGGIIPPIITTAATGGAADRRRKRYLAWVKEQKRKKKTKDKTVYAAKKSGDLLVNILKEAAPIEIQQLPNIEEITRFYVEMQLHQKQEKDKALRNSIDAQLINLKNILPEYIRQMHDDDAFMLLFN